MCNIVFGHNIPSDKEIILVGLREMVEIPPMVEPLVAGSRQNPDDLRAGTCGEKKANKFGILVTCRVQSRLIVEFISGFLADNAVNYRVRFEIFYNFGQY